MIRRISGRALPLPGDAFSELASEPLIFGSSDALVAIILRKSSYILLTKVKDLHRVYVR
jgi:hypothetical protein